VKKITHLTASFEKKLVIFHTQWSRVVLELPGEHNQQEISCSESASFMPVNSYLRTVADSTKLFPW